MIRNGIPWLMVDWHKCLSLVSLSVLGHEQSSFEGSAGRVRLFVSSRMNVNVSNVLANVSRVDI